MFLSKSRILYVIIPLAGYFGSYHCGLTNAEARETLIISTVMTASLQTIPSQITNTADLRQENAAKTVRNFKTKVIFAMPQMPTVQTSTVETANYSSGDSSPPRATKKHSLGARIVQTTTLHIYSPAVLTAIITTVVSSRSSDGTNGLIRIEPTHTASFSQYLLRSPLPSNSTVNPHSPEDNGKDCSEKINDEACNTYVTRWVDFYLNVSHEMFIQQK